MDTRFSFHLETWLTALLRQKALAHAADRDPPVIGAADFSIFISDYILQTLGEDPRSCLHCCGLDDVSDRELADATGFDRDALAAGLIGAVVELGPWLSDDGVSLLTQNGVLEEDAIEFAHACDIATEKLGARGQALIAATSQRGEAVTATA